MTVEAAARVQIHRPLPPEEQARADFYALFASLLNAAPDAKLLGTIAVAGEIPDDGEPALAKAWREFVAAASVMDEQAAADEYQALFLGVGAVYAVRYLRGRDPLDDMRSYVGVHAGVTMLLADVAGAMAIAARTERGGATTNVSLHCLAAAKVGPLRATATMLRASRNSALADVRVIDVGNADRLVAVAHVSCGLFAEERPTS